MDFSLSAFAPENLVSRDGFGSPVPRQPAYLHTQAELVAVVNLFVLNLVCFVGRAALTFPSPPNNSSDLFIGPMRMRGNQSYTSVLVARWWLLLTPDGKVWGFGERIISVCPSIPETGRLENTCRKEKKKTLRRVQGTRLHVAFSCRCANAAILYANS